MVRALALILALALAVIAVDSPLFCVDGCDWSETAHHQGAPVTCGSCVTCQTGTIPEARVEPGPLLIATTFASCDEERPVSPSTDSVEHPPRAA